MHLVVRLALLAAAALALLGLPGPARSQFACAGAAGVGAGFCSPAPSCSPFTYAGGPLYQSLTLADTWTANQATLTTSAVSSPACTVSGANLREDATASAQHRTFKQPSVTLTAAAHTVTVFAMRTVGTRNVHVDVDDSGFAGGVFSYFDLGTCAPIGGSSGAFGTWSGYSASASLVSGWCKLVTNFTSASATNPLVFAYLVSGTSDTYSGDNTSTNSLWGLDLR